MFESIAWFGKRAPRAHIAASAGHYLVYDKKVLKFQNMIGEYLVHDQKSINFRNMYASYMVQDERSIFLGGQHGQILTSDAQNLNFTAPALTYLVDDEENALIGRVGGEYTVQNGNPLFARFTAAHYAVHTPGRTSIIGAGAGGAIPQPGVVGVVSVGASHTVVMTDRDRIGVVCASASYTAKLQDPDFGIVCMGASYATPTQQEQSILIGELSGFYAVKVPLFTESPQTEV